MKANPTSSGKSPNASHKDTLTAVLDKLGEIVTAASGGSFVFRGEPRCYEEISSSLYREYKTRLEPFGLQGFDIRHVQDEILDEAVRFTEDLTPLDLLSQLQHYGHPTNLIDFTADYLIALFFACASEPSHDGRLILLSSETAALYRMRTPANRIKAQKSVFVNPPTGTIKPDQIIPIPRDLKLPILEYLRSNHEITTNTIYDDIHGFIRNASIHRSAYAESHIARLYFNQGRLLEALEHYSSSIALNGSKMSSYANRGSVFLLLERFDEAIQDFTQAIALDSEDPGVYLRRGIAYYSSGRPALAEADLSEAIRLDEQLVDAYEQRALARVQLQDFEGVIEDTSSAINLDPKRKTAYNSRGLARWMIADNEGARRDFDRAIEIDPTYTIAYHNRFELHFGLREYGNAIGDLDQYIQLGGDDLSYAHFSRGVAKIAFSAFAEARADLRMALDIEPSVAKRVFESDERVSDFVQGLDLEGKVPDDVLRMLMPRE